MASKTTTTSPTIQKDNMNHGGMVIIPPPDICKDTSYETLLLEEAGKQKQQSILLAEQLQCLRYLGQRLLPAASTQDFLNEYLEQHSVAASPESVRMIQANRYEIFVQNVPGDSSTSQKSTDCLDQLLLRNRLDPMQIKQSLIEFAISQAQRDTRLFPTVGGDAGQQQGKNDGVACGREHHGNYKFGNFSLIVTYGAVEAQAPHIDLLYPNHQFGLIVSDKSPSTLWYTPQHEITTKHDLLLAWERANHYDAYYYYPTEAPLTIPPSLKTALQNSADAQTLIRGFGNVLVPDEELQSANVVHGGPQLSSLSAGTLLSLPGSVVHAGPACTEFRAVLFFSAWPKANVQQTADPPAPACFSSFAEERKVQVHVREHHLRAGDHYHHGHGPQEQLHTPRRPADKSGSEPSDIVENPKSEDGKVTTTKVAEYHPDTQYSSVFLCGRLVQLLWRQVGMDYDARRYLLYQLYRYIRQGGNHVTPKAKRTPRNWAMHYTWDAFTAFVARIEQDMTTRQQDWQLIEETAHNELLCFYNVLGSRHEEDEKSGETDGTLRGDFLQVSVPHLYISWKEEEVEDDEGDRQEQASSSSSSICYYHVQIFERPLDGKVLVFYPKDPTNTDMGFSWEGAEPDKHYRLIRHHSANNDHQNNNQEYWFDGTNATLLDSDGDPIHCIVRPPSSSSKDSTMRTTTKTAHSGSSSNNFEPSNNRDPRSDSSSPSAVVGSTATAATTKPTASQKQSRDNKRKKSPADSSDSRKKKNKKQKDTTTTARTKPNQASIANKSVMTKTISCPNISAHHHEPPMEFKSSSPQDERIKSEPSSTAQNCDSSDGNHDECTGSSTKTATTKQELQTLAQLVVGAEVGAHRNVGIRRNVGGTCMDDTLFDSDNDDAKSDDSLLQFYKSQETCRVPTTIPATLVSVSSPSSLSCGGCGCGCSCCGDDEGSCSPTTTPAAFLASLSSSSTSSPSSSLLWESSLSSPTADAKGLRLSIPKTTLAAAHQSQLRNEKIWVGAATLVEDHDHQVL